MTNEFDSRSSGDGESASTAVSRRGFLAASGGLSVGVFLGGFGAAGKAEGSATTPGLVNSWLNVSASNAVSLTIGTTEMGQGSRSGFAQIIAEDLCVDVTRVTILQGAATLAYTGSTAVARGYATSTGGSGAIRNNFWALRDAATRAREILVMAAMDLTGDSTRANYSTANAVVKHLSSGRNFTYGQLADAASAKSSTAIAADSPLSSLTVIGKTIPRGDIPPKLNGTAIYGVDVLLPNMVFAVVKHCPTYGGYLASNPAKPALAIAVVPLTVYDFLNFADPTKFNAATGTFGLSTLKLSRGPEIAGKANAVAVVCTNTWDALNAAKLSVSWTLPASASTMNDSRFLADATALSSQSTMPSAPPGLVTSTSTTPTATLYTCEGSYPAVPATSQVLDATYTLPYVAHAAMEVLSCAVDYVPGTRCNLFVSTQVQQNALKLVFLLLRQLGDTVVAPLKADGTWDTSRIQINTTYLGGALGRKLELDFISQAVQAAVGLSKLAAGARPLKLMWSREEDFARDQFRPMALVRARAGLSGTGANARIAGWEYRVISPSIAGQRGTALNTDPTKGVVGDSQGSESARELPYAMDQRLTEYVTHPSQIPLGYWRSVGASINIFAVESMIDELAFAASADPYRFRRSRLAAEAAAGSLLAQRWVAVLDKLATLANWGSPASGASQGIAIGSAFNSIIAMVVELSTSSTTSSTGVTTTSINVRKVSAALDSYMVVNPGSVEAQLQGGIVHAINATLYGRQTFVNGVAQRKNFNTYKLIRNQQMPVVQVAFTQPAIVERQAVIGGVGELGVPTLAPALANAYFKSTGKRVRNLPFFP